MFDFVASVSTCMTMTPTSLSNSTSWISICISNYIARQPESTATSVVTFLTPNLFSGLEAYTWSCACLKHTSDHLEHEAGGIRNTQFPHPSPYYEYINFLLSLLPPPSFIFYFSFHRSSRFCSLGLVCFNWSYKNNIVVTKVQVKKQYVKEQLL